MTDPTGQQPQPDNPQQPYPGQVPPPPPTPYGAPDQPQAAPTPYAAPAQPPGQPTTPVQNPYGGTTQNPYGAPAQNPYGGTTQNPYTGSPANPYAGPRKSNKKLWIILGSVIGGVVLLGIIGIVIAVSVAASAVNAPKRAAGEYLQDIADGKASAALKLSTTPKSDQTLLTDAVLAGASQRISKTKVSDISVYGSNATAQVQYSLGGDTYTPTIALKKVDGAWKVTNGVEESAPYFTSDYGWTIKGYDGVIDGDAAASSVKLFPAEYTVLPPSKYFDVSNGDFTVADATGVGSVSKISVQPNDAFVKAVQDQLDSAIDSCTSKIAAWKDLDACDISVDYPDKVDTDTAKVTIADGTYPTIALDDSSGYANWSLTDAGSVTVTASGPGWDGAAATETLKGDFSYLYVNVDYKDGKPVVTFDN